MRSNMVASETKWVNSILNIIGVNSLRLGGLKSVFLKNVDIICEGKHD